MTRWRRSRAARDAPRTGAPGMTGVATIVGYALRESLRRRVFAVVLVLTAGFLGLFAFGAAQAFEDVQGLAGPQRFVDPRAFTGATILGLAMFATLFLGAVLAVFLTLGVVRGDAERGLLQPLVVRPLGRTAMLLGRLGGAAAVSALYVAVVYAAAVAITRLTGGWTPSGVVVPGLALAAGVVVIAALSVLGSVFLSSTANGIAVLMAFGAGLTAGLLGQIGSVLGSSTLEAIGRIASWALPFEALYQAALHAMTAQTPGLTGVVLRLGPFGGAQAGGPGLVAWTVAYLAGVSLLAVWAFGRRDL